MVWDTTNNVLGQSISPNPGVATPKTKPVASLAAHDTIASPAPQMNEQQFTAWFTDLVPKVDKKKFPVGSTIKSEWVEITALEWWKYSMKHGAVIYNYDSHAEFTANIGKIIKTPSERLALLKSTESNRILNHMKWYTGIEVPGAPWLRWKHDGHGKMSFEKKNQENGSWNAVEIAALTPEEQLAAAAHFYGVKPSQILEWIKKSEWTSAHEAIWHAEKEGFIKKNWLTAWHKVEEWFKKIKDGTIGAWKTAVWAPFNILSWVTNWGHGASWGKSFATGAVLEGISMATHPFDTEQWRDSDGNINWWNAGEALAYALIAANCGIPRALLASGAWGMYDLYSHSNIAQKPWAEVLAK